MTYDIFKKEFISSVSEKVGDGFSTHFTQVKKNNGVSYDAVVISRKDSNISPRIYLVPYFKIYQNSDFDSAVEHFINDYKTCISSNEWDEVDFFDFESLKSTIYYSLINRELNEDLLNEIVHIDYLDLAIVFYCRIGENASVPVKNFLLSIWDVTEFTLLDYAIRNTKGLLGLRKEPMLDFFLNHIKARLNEKAMNEMLPEEFSLPLIILSNEGMEKGAGVILYENLLKDLSDEIGSDLFILPSSIHEVLVLTTNCDISINELLDMIYQINHHELAKDEVLSDNLYLYKRKYNMLCLIENNLYQ